MPEPDLAEAARLRRLHDVAPSRTLYALCALGVPDFIASGTRTVAELARNCGADPDTLARILRAAVALDVVEAGPDGHWRLLPAGRLLCADTPGSLRAEFADNDLFEGWNEFLHSVRTGEPCYPKRFGESIFTRLSTDGTSLRNFHQHMHARAYSMYGPLLSMDVWPQDGLCVDVCGGTGGLLAQLLGSRPQLRGVLHDRDEVLALSPLPHDPAVSRRVRLAPGDVFTEVPTGGDAYLLASVLHDWGDEDAGAILRRCRQAAGEDARLLVIDRVLPEGGRHPAVFSDMWMLAMAGGRERTCEEWSQLLIGSGFEPVAVHRSGETEMAVIECRAPRRTAC